MQVKTFLIVILFVLCAVFPIFCSVMNYNWFFEHRKARFIVKLFGRTGARIFYFLLGIIIFVCGAMAYMSGQI